MNAARRARRRAAALPSVAARALARAMAVLSEERYASGWYLGLEYELWAELHADVPPADVDVADLLPLSVLAGGWVAWNADLGCAELVPDAAWRARYAAHVARAAAGPPTPP